MGRKDATTFLNLGGNMTSVLSVFALLLMHVYCIVNVSVCSL